MIKYTRWYDKYPDFKSLLQIISSIDEYNMDLIAQDFIQIIVSKYKNEFDSVIEKMSQNPPPGYNRWYDKNYNLHTCVEFIKTLKTEKEREELINALIMAFLSFMTGRKND